MILLLLKLKERNKTFGDNITDFWNREVDACKVVNQYLADIGSDKRRTTYSGQELPADAYNIAVLPKILLIQPFPMLKHSFGDNILLWWLMMLHEPNGKYFSDALLLAAESITIHDQEMQNV